MAVDRLKVSMKILLANEEVKGVKVDHWARFRIAITSEGLSDGDKGFGKWKQIGSIDRRFPEGGMCRFENNHCLITGGAWGSRSRGGGRVFAIQLRGLARITSSTEGRGLAKIVGRPDLELLGPWLKSYQPKLISTLAPPRKKIQWRGKGAWEILENSWESNTNVRYLTSAWKVGGSVAVGGGALVVGTMGYFILTDPEGTDWTYQYAGVGLGAGVKGSELVKDVLGGLSAGVGFEALPSTGGILKNPMTLGAQELKKEDFCGYAIWGEASLICGAGFSGTAFVIRPRGNYLPTAALLMGGASVGGGAGVGILKGGIEPTF